MALINNIMHDIKVKCAEEDLLQKNLAEIAGIAPAYITQITKKPVVLPSYVNLMESIGYDIKMVYVKRKQDQRDS